MVALCVILLASGCGIQEAGRFLDRAEACAEATETAQGVLTRISQLASDPGQLKKQLHEAGARLEEAGAKSGDPALNGVLSGLASTYKSTVATDKASAVAAAEKVRVSTISSFRVFSRACGDS
ncbi:hypothetical protein SAMN05421505_10273 [Sinosporangium album]|uniref:Uncharacterized protein n=1 Tax=Sinosporangium album TaxID=504805 RepID=A0A1G7RW94_9ACTN|nr:hypothetical protein SAMN05421505_10273 [Sinosporangium album]